MSARATTAKVMALCMLTSWTMPAILLQRAFRGRRRCTGRLHGLQVQSWLPGAISSR